MLDHPWNISHLLHRTPRTSVAPSAFYPNNSWNYVNYDYANLPYSSETSKPIHHPRSQKLHPAHANTTNIPISQLIISLSPFVTHQRASSIKPDRSSYPVRMIRWKSRTGHVPVETESKAETSPDIGNKMLQSNAHSISIIVRPVHPPHSHPPRTLTE